MCKLSVGREEDEGDLSGITRSGLSGEDIEVLSYVGDLSLGCMVWLIFVVTVSTISHFPQIYYYIFKEEKGKEEKKNKKSLYPSSSRLLLLLQKMKSA